MKGIIYAFLGGICITLQGVVNSRISQDIGILQTITITHFTAFILASFILLFVRDGSYTQIKKVKLPYLFAGAFGLVIIINEVTAIQSIGVTLTMAVLLTVQIVMAFLIDAKGLFGLKKQKLYVPQFIGIGMMITGILIMQW
ncbi:DMT family transporter [Paenibacillus sp. 481]|uniref:DMT family transporter n=1 Tax=Paenibacillus sp. 481 TaxID=2835869 RepID=UPI001E4E73FA|nr:DMT family transporter [Paenibacillus sp. 481]UHA73309.1 DMT family transporter [Paenibacillus sp. 481]